MSRLNDIKKAIETAQKVPLGELIEPVSNQVNKSGNNYPFMGVNINKQIVPTVANVSAVDPKKYIHSIRRRPDGSGILTD